MVLLAVEYPLIPKPLKNNYWVRLFYQQNMSTLLESEISLINVSIVYNEMSWMLTLSFAARWCIVYLFVINIKNEILLNIYKTQFDSYWTFNFMHKPKHN